MKEHIKELVIKALQKEGISLEREIIIDVPANKENGDYSTNIAMQLAKSAGQKPVDLANKIIENIKDEQIIQMKVAGPGFINFFVAKDYLLDNINYVLQEKENYGRNHTGNNKKINIEFVSANPTGILHLGNARGGAYGDSLARILRFNGYDVTEEYYVNDAGNQINNLGLSLQARYFDKCGLPNEMPENGYYGKEIVTMAEELYEKHGNNLQNESLEFYKEYGTEKLLNKIKAVLERYRIHFDVYTSEKSIYAQNKIPKILEQFERDGYAYEQDGALWFKSTAFGDEKDHVLIKDDKTYTYFVPDIAYHLDKINRGFEKLYDVLGTDHHGYVARLKGSIKALGYNPDILNVKLLQLVRLVKDGEEIKMSKRTGNTVTLEELLDEVGENAARYFFTMRSLDTQMDFDLEMAKKTSNENPVFYVCYAYARISTILKEYQQLPVIDKYVTIKEEEAYNVLEMVYKFPEVVKDAGTKELPHLITNYVYDLANLFHTFYSKYRIIVSDQKKTEENLNLIKAVQITIANALNLIGVIPPEKM